MKLLTAKPYIAIELVMLTVGIPGLIVAAGLVGYMIPILWSVALYCFLVHRATTGQGMHDIWAVDQVTREALKPILTRFALAALFLAVGMLVLLPEQLFSFAREKPALYAAIMVLYPILSVIPQEIIFRVFFFRRYAHIFPSRELMVIASGLSFGLAHIIFENWVAPLLCAVGGILFAMTYARRHALSLVTLEHAFYGDFIFTIGLGFYFYHGSVAAVAAVAQ